MFYKANLLQYYLWLKKNKETHAPAKNFDSGFSHEYILMKRMLDKYSFIVRTCKTKHSVPFSPPSLFSLTHSCMYVGYSAVILANRAYTPWIKNVEWHLNACMNEWRNWSWRKVGCIETKFLTGYHNRSQFLTPTHHQAFVHLIYFSSLEIAINSI